jgi:hypothetical protein
VVGQPLAHLGRPRPLDVAAVPAGDDLPALGGDDQRRLVGPVVPGEIGEVFGGCRRAVDIADIGFDPDRGQDRLRLQAELTAFFGENLKNQGASSHRASQVIRWGGEINPAIKKLTSRENQAGIKRGSEHTRPRRAQSRRRGPGLTGSAGARGGAGLTGRAPPRYHLAEER